MTNVRWRMAVVRSDPLLDQILNVGIQRRCNPRHHHDRRIPFPALHARQVGLVNTGPVGELLLREPFGAAQRLQIETDSLPHIHAGMARRDLTSAHRLLVINDATDGGR